MDGQRETQTGQVRSLTRALAILRALGESGPGMTLSALAEATGLPPSTTHRLLTTLEAERFVRPDPQTGLWRVGVAAFHVGMSFASARDRLTIARPYLARLMETSGETASLFVESDGEAVCIGQIESRHTMRAITATGGRVQLHATAAGKALVAHLDPQRRAQIMSAMEMAAFTDNTIAHRSTFAAALEEVRAVGYAIDDEEFVAGLRCVAAPIFDETGLPAAAVSISGPSARIDRARLPGFGRLVARVASEATRDYGGQAPLAAQ